MLKSGFAPFWLLLLAGAICLVAGRVAFALFQYRRRLHERDTQLDAAINSSGHGFCMFGPDGRVLLWNETMLQIYMVPIGQSVRGCDYVELLRIFRGAGNMISDVRHLAEMRGAIARREYSDLTIEMLDGRFINIVHRPMADGGWIATHQDVTDRKQAEARFSYLALHDVVTGLPNRAAFNHRIDEGTKLAQVDNTSFAVIRLGVDRFKEINDVFGQSAGDAVLAKLAEKLRETCHWGYLARAGGDEFSIVSPPVRAIDEIYDQLSGIFDNEFHIDGQDIRVSCTAGISTYPRDGSDVETLIANADIALWRAKAEARGTALLFESAMDQQLREKRALHRDLAVALKNGEFEIYFQPQATTQREIVGFETLLRWHHPVRGMVSPGVFIPLAEETGLIGAIDEWVLRSACKEAASWPNPLAIAVNFSPLDFRRLDVPKLILSALLESGLAPARLEIEITEGVLIDDFDAAISMLRRIKNLGVRVAMDDFGTGYSSLSYLLAFPFDKIKIDQTFIAKLDSRADSAVVVEAIVSLSHTLKLPVIAEGVETEGQLAFLSRCGCDEVQGYLIGRPQPIGHYRDVMNGVAFKAGQAALAG
jgi:diguanylate cyclase (GGDEF)-like protein